MKIALYILLVTLAWATSINGWSQSYTIDTVDFNSSAMDFGPVYYKDGVIYCSNRKSRILSNYFDENSTRVTDLYFWNDSTGVSEFQSNLNTKVHEGPICFTLNQDTLFSTQNQLASIKGFNGKENPLGIYMKTFKEGKWGTSVKLPFVDVMYSYAHPYYHPTSKRLYFSSNIEGGKGGMDLYYSELINGTWSDPVNLGDNINTAKNELFPFIDGSHVLYFSTNYYSDNGDLDIYYTSTTGDAWSTPTKLDEPINSSFDDFSYISDSTNDRGYFSSNRSGNDDIYSFSYIYPTFDDCEENHKPSLCWEFAEEEAVDLDSVPVVYQWVISTGDTIKGLSIEYCFPDTGYYEISLSLHDTITDLTYMNVGEYALSIEAFNRPYIESKDTVSINSSISLQADISRLTNYDIKEYFWDLGDGKMSKGANITYTPEEVGYIYPILGVIAINKITKEEEKLCAYKVIEVYEPPYYDSTDIIAGYDENELDIIEHTEAPNDTMMYSVQLFESDSLYSTDDSLFSELVNRVYPRLLDQKGTYSYEIMYGENISSLYDDFAKAIELGFDETILQQIAKNALTMDTSFFTRLNNATLVNLLSSGALDGIASNELSIYFDVNSYTVIPQYRDSINQICSGIDKNSIFLIEGHTDANGSFEYNLKLSENRVKEVKQILFRHGFFENNMTSVWFGEKFAKLGNEKGLNEVDRKVTLVIIKK